MSKETIIENLRSLVSEWLLATGGDLNEAKTSVEMLLIDVCNSLDISPDEIGLS